MTNIHEERLKAKLEFWNTPGFSAFLADLQNQCGPEINIMGNAETLRRKYQDVLKDMQQSRVRFKQGKLPL